MSRQALYRKWRPRAFEDVAGQEHVTRTLRNAVLGDNVAHAYLFSGPRGTGKTSSARLLAKAVNCLRQGSSGDDVPCNACPICREVEEGRLMDLIEIDAASNRGIDEIRDLREKVNFKPSEARVKFYIIDEVHMLTNEAFNALLKTLEEPPEHVIFVLATTEPHKIPATVVSRCQRFDFRRITLAEIEKRLSHIAGQEGLDVEERAISFIAQNASGSMRDAISLLDQLTSYGDETITLEQVQNVLGLTSSLAVSELVDFIVGGDVSGGLSLLNRVVGDGADPRQFTREVVEYMRGMLLIKAGDGAAMLSATRETIEAMQRQADGLETSQLLRMLRLFNEAALEMKAGFLPQLPLELAFVEALTPEANRPAAPTSAPTSAPASAPASASTHAPPSAPAPAPKQPAPKTPAPETPVEPAAPSGPLTLEGLRAGWDDFLARFRSYNRTVQALLVSSCEPISVKDGVITIGFYHTFHKSKVEEERNKGIVEQALGEMFGGTYRVDCITIDRTDRVDSKDDGEEGGEKRTDPPEPAEGPSEKEKEAQTRELLDFARDLGGSVEGED